MATQKITYPVRPLNKGIVRNLAPNGLPMGAIYNCDGAILKQRGISRRPAFRLLTTVEDIEYFRLLTFYTKSDGDVLIVFITNLGEFWTYDPETDIRTMIEAKYIPTLSPDQNLSGTIGTSVISLAVGDWESAGLVIGDKVVLTTETLTIVELLTLTTARVEEVISATFDTIDWYGVYKNIGGGDIEDIDYVQYVNFFIFTDNYRSPMYFDGSTITRVGGAEAIRCKTLLVASDRLYMGNITYIATVPAGELKADNKKIIWADIPGDLDSMLPESVFLRLPYVRGSITKLTFLGNMVMCYFTSGVMIGRRTTVAGSYLPYAFDRFETGHRGVQNIDCVASSRDGNFFVSTDNVYNVSGDFAMNAISKAIAEELFESGFRKDKTAILNDPENNYLYLLASVDGINYDTILPFNLETGAWGRFTVRFQQIALIDYISAVKYKEYDPLLKYQDIDPLTTYADQPLTEYTQQLAITDGPNIYVFNPDALDDHDGPVHFEFETGDMDLDLQDKNKGFYRFSIKMLRELLNLATFHIEGSVDQGVTWRDLGDVAIQVGEIEGYVNFLMTGPMIRFKVTSDGLSKNYLITELALDVKLKGAQNKNLA